MGKIPRNSVSLAGEFAVLSQLALRGYDASMTLGRTKSIDILVSKPETNKMYRLEVKTAYNAGRNGEPVKSKLFGKTFSWQMDEKHEQISDSKLFYCFVDLGGSVSPIRFFIVPSKLVSEYVKNTHQYWLSTKENPKESDSVKRIFRIGFDKNDCKIKTPLAKKYENNWEFKK